MQRMYVGRDRKRISFRSIPGHGEADSHDARKKTSPNVGHNQYNRLKKFGSARGGFPALPPALVIAKYAPGRPASFSLWLSAPNRTRAGATVLPDWRC